MVDRINQSNTADLVKELLDAEKRAEEDTARRAQIEAQAVAQIEAQDIEIQEESVTGPRISRHKPVLSKTVVRSGRHSVQTRVPPPSQAR